MQLHNGNMGGSHGVKGKSCEHRNADELEKNSPSGGYVL